MKRMQLSGFALAKKATVLFALLVSVIGFTTRLFAQTVAVNGTVELGGTTNFSGVEVYFEPLSPSAREATVLSNAAGGWVKADLVVGIYNIRFRKDGYVPGIIPNVFISIDTTFNTVFLRAGGTKEISGELFGTLSGDTLYFVTADLTVPSGKTLTIEGGAELQFRNGSGLTVNGGTLLVNGTDTDSVYFTSGAPVPNFGDWKGIVINGGSGHRITRATFHYQVTALQINNFSDVVLDRIRIERVALQKDNLVVWNGTNFKLLNSYITSKEMPNAYLSTISNVEVRGNYFHNGRTALRIGIVSNGVITENRFQDYDVYAISEYSANNYKQKADTHTNGTIPQINSESWNLEVDNNEFNSILYRNERVIYLPRYQNSKISNNKVYIGGNKKIDNRWQFVTLMSGLIENNELEFDNAATYYTYMYNLFYSEGNVRIRENNVKFFNDTYVYDLRYASIRDGEFVNNTITVYTAEYSNEVANFSGTELIEGNQIRYVSDYATNPRSRFSSVKVIKNNSFEFITRYGYNVYSDNTIDFTNCELVSNNKITLAIKPEDGWNIAIRDNTNFIENTVEAIRGLLVERLPSNAKIANNTILLGQFQNLNVEQAGIFVTSNSTGSILNNTILADTKNGVRGFGIKVGGNSEPRVINNHIQGFENGIELDNETGDVFYNNFHSVTNLFAGLYTIPFAGNMATVNHLGTQSDIYYNTAVNPQFIKDYGFVYGDVNWADTAANSQPELSHIFQDTYDVNLKSTSPLINAGSDLFIDIDGTRSDIGAFAFDFGNPKYLTSTDELDGQLLVEFEPVQRDSVLGYRVYAAEVPNEPTFRQTVASTASSFTLTGLTNNVEYEVYMTAVYPSGESIKSKSEFFVPGQVNADAIESSLRVEKADLSNQYSYEVKNIGSKTVSLDVVFKKITVGSDRDPNVSGLTYITESNGYTFYVNPSNMYWWDHYNTARNQGLQLAEISSANQNDQIREALNNRYGSSRWFWFGLRRLTNGSWGYYKNYRYVDNGEDMYEVYDEIPATYTNWEPGEPNGSGNVALLRDGVMFDEYEYEYYGYYGIYQDAPFFRTYLPAQTVTLAPNESITITDTLFSTKGVFLGQIDILRAGTTQKLDSISVVLLSGLDAGLEPVYFPTVQATENSHLFVINEAKVDGSDLVAGDEIGLYDGTKLVGSVSFNGQFPIVVDAFGFTDGNPLKLMYYMAQTRELVEASYTITQGAETYTSGSYSMLTSSGTQRMDNALEFLGNRFNLLSFFVNPPDKQIANVFSGMGVLIAQDDEGNAWIPNYGINQIGEMRLERAYQVFATADTNRLTVSGKQIRREEVPVYLFGNRFNNVPMLYPSPADVTQVFDAISTRVSIIQDDNGLTWIPSLNVNTLGDLIPGKGYQLFMTGTKDTTIVYPDVIPNKRSTPKVMEQPEFYTGVTNTGLPWNIVVDASSSLEGIAEISVWDADMMVGSAVVIPHQHVVITAFRADASYNLSGFTAGNTVLAKGWNRETNQEVTLELRNVTNGELAVFGQGEYGHVKTESPFATGLTEEIPTVFSLEQNYPNPFNPSTTIRFSLPVTSKVEMDVYNIVGQRVATLVNNTMQPGYHQVEWNASRLASGSYLVRMRAGDFTKVIKVTLIK